jgi:tetratricopeptide (TPR) repeat protein
MKRGTRQRTFDEARERTRSDSTEAAAPETTDDRGLAPGASRAVPHVESEPQLPLPREVARMEQRPFVGRAAPLQRLRERWSESSRGQGGLMAIGGEPGIGKTRLAARFAGEVHGAGGSVLYGRADEDGVSPYQPFVETLRHYAAHRPRLREQPGLEAPTRLLAALVPELGQPAGRPSDPHDRHQLLEAVLQLFAHAASERPLLVILEDLHWADAPTAVLLRALPRRCAGSRVLVVATYRDLETDATDPLAQALIDLRRECLLERIFLAGFDRSETAALIAARAGDEADVALTNRLCGQTGGNPFFIEELMRSLAEAPDAAAGVPAGVKDVIGRRLDRLPPPALETLTLAAVLGIDFRLSTLRLVAAELATDELLASLEAAVAARLVVEDHDEVDRFSFAHALVRETLYERLIASRRLRLHQRVAEALETAPVPVHPAELAHHYFQARQVGGAAKAVVHSLRAAEVALAVRAPEEAADHYERALAALEIVRGYDAAARCDVMLALGAARWQASRPDRGSTFMQAIELARGLGSADRLAQAALGAGGRFYAPGAVDVPEIELLDEALAGLPAGDSALRVRVLARQAENLVCAEPTARARALAGEALDTARRLGEPEPLTAALMGLHAALLHVDHADERRRLAEEALAVAGELGAVETSALGRHWLLYDLTELGQLDEAWRRHVELELLAGELQQPLYRHAALVWRSVLTALAGRFDEAERLACDSVALAERARAPGARMHFTAQLAALRREQGRLDVLLPELERFAGSEPSVGPWHGILPLAYLDAGDRSRARSAHDAALAGGVSAVPRTMFWLTTLASLAESAALLEDPDGAAQLYAALEPHADRLAQWSFTGNAGSVHRALGRTAAVAERRDHASEHFENALRRHAALCCRPLLARTQCDYGELLLTGTRADRARARMLLREAHLAARHFGMQGVASRAECSG